MECQAPGIPLLIVESPHRALVGPVTTCLDVLALAWPPEMDAPNTIVVLPEFPAPTGWTDCCITNRQRA